VDPNEFIKLLPKESFKFEISELITVFRFAVLVHEQILTRFEDEIKDNDTKEQPLKLCSVEMDLLLITQEKSEAIIEFTQTDPNIHPCLDEITLFCPVRNDWLPIICDRTDDEIREFLEFLIQLLSPPKIIDPEELLKDSIELSDQEL